MTETKGDPMTQNSREDVLAVEAATDLLVRGLNRADISSITDLVMETTLLLPPARRTTRGKRRSRLGATSRWGRKGSA